MIIHIEDIRPVRHGNEPEDFFSVSCSVSQVIDGSLRAVQVPDFYVSVDELASESLFKSIIERRIKEFIKQDLYTKYIGASFKISND